jgi:hypothetical protein
MLNIKATLIYFDKLNLNNRIYKRENINLIELINSVNRGQMYGEFNHPDNYDISLSNVSHFIKEIYVKENKLIGNIIIVDTQKGKLAQQIFKDNVKIKNTVNLSFIDKIKIYRNLKFGKNIIDLDILDTPFVFRPRSSGIVNENNEVIIDKIFTFDLINQEEDSFKNIR